MLSCYDAKTGKPAYSRQRIAQAKGFTSSPWANDGKVFCLDEASEPSGPGEFTPEEPL